jgi:hypothetical protein
MSHNSFGHLFRFTTWGESHGPAIGAVVDGCPPGLALSEADIQPWLDRRRPGTSRFTTQRQEPDQVRILSGTYEGRTTGTPISLTPMMPSTACAIRAAAGAPRREKLRRGWRPARSRGLSSPR